MEAPVGTPPLATSGSNTGPCSAGVQCYLDACVRGLFSPHQRVSGATTEGLTAPFPCYAATTRSVQQDAGSSSDASAHAAAAGSRKRRRSRRSGNHLYERQYVARQGSAIARCRWALRALSVTPHAFTHVVPVWRSSLRQAPCAREACD